MMPPVLAGEKTDELAITQVAPEWCAANAGGVLLLLFLTSVRTPWLPHIDAAIRMAAARDERRRAAILSVFRLDKRYPLDFGFDRNLDDVREAVRGMAPFIGSNAIVLEFGGFLAWTMKTTVNTLAKVVRTKSTRTFHDTVISGAASIIPHASPSHVRSAGYYVDAVNRMKTQLGCKLD